MSFEAEAKKRASRRAALVKIRPRINITEQLIAEGAGHYCTTIDFPISLIEAHQGSNLTNKTEVTVDPELSNDLTYRHDEETGKLTLYLSNAPDSFTNMIVVHPLVLVATEAIRAPKTPDTSESERLWEPRLKSSPEVSQSFANQFEGIVTTDSLSVEISASDERYSSLLHGAASFANATIDIWFQVENEIRKVFTGLIDSYNLDQESIIFDCKTLLSRLNESAYMGDSLEETTHRAGSGIRQVDVGKPIPFFFGSSPFAVKDDAIAAVYRRDTPGSGNDDYIFKGHALDVSKLGEAIITDYNPIIGEFRNLGPYVLGRVPPGGLQAISFGTVVSAYYFDTDVDLGRYYKYDAGSTTDSDRRALLELKLTGHNLEVGDTFYFSSNSIYSGDNRPVVVTEVKRYGSDTFDTIRCICYRDLVQGTYNNTDLTNSISFSNSLVRAVVLHDTLSNFVTFVTEGIDYTVQASTSSSGNKLLSINFYSHSAFYTHRASNNPDTRFNPDRFRVLFRIKTATKSTHGEAAEHLLSQVGIHTISQSFTNADINFEASVALSIPALNESDYSPYRTYIEKLLQSTLSFLRTDPVTSETGYYLFEAPFSGDKIDKHIYYDLTHTTDYADMITELALVNDEYPSADVTLNIKAAEIEHGGRKSKTIHHCLTDTGDRKGNMVAARAAPREIYRFKVSSHLLAHVAGDNIILMLANDEEVPVKIISISKSIDEIEVEATPLRGLS